MSVCVLMYEKKTMYIYIYTRTYKLHMMMIRIKKRCICVQMRPRSSKLRMFISVTKDKRHVLNEYNHQFGHETRKLRFIPMIGICGSFQPYHRWYRINPHHGVVAGPGSLGIGGSSILNGQVLIFNG